MEQRQNHREPGLFRTVLKTATELTIAVQDELPKVAPKVTEELSQVIEDAKHASSLSNMLEIFDEKIKRITHAIKDDIAQKVASIQRQIQRQFLYQWMVILLGIGVSIALAFFR